MQNTKEISFTVVEKSRAPRLSELLTPVMDALAILPPDKALCLEVPEGLKVYTVRNSVVGLAKSRNMKLATAVRDRKIWLWVKA